MQLKASRDHHGLHPVDVARRLTALGIAASSPNTVRRHENGEREPHIRAIEAYRRITEVEVTFDDWAALAEQSRHKRSNLTSQSVMS